jgi:DNA-binding helix-hairpin-helix protein with protein kinase domain
MQNGAKIMTSKPLNVKIPMLGIEAELDKEAGRGKQAVVYSLKGEPTLLVKILTSSTKDIEDRITTELKFVATLDMKCLDNYQFAWPLAKVYDQDEKFIGYAMENFKKGYCPLRSLFSSNSKKPWDYSFFLEVCRNLAAAVSALHKRHIKVGDLQLDNVLVSKNASIVILDTDSFQFSYEGETYRSPLACLQFVPPELLGIRLASVDRLVQHDSYSLAVILFLLMLSGNHPFQAKYIGKKGSPPTLLQKVAKNNTPYFRDNLRDFQVRDSSPPLDLIPPELRELFRRCFIIGHKHPKRRPKAAEWQKAITLVLRNEKQIKKSNRIYQAYLSKIEDGDQHHIRSPPRLSWTSAVKQVKTHPWVAGCITALCLAVLCMSMYLLCFNNKANNQPKRPYDPFCQGKPTQGKKATPHLWRYLYENPE